MHKKIGPLFIMVRYMRGELCNLLVILLVVMVGYGVALHAILYPLSPSGWSLFNGIFQMPFFQLYGEVGVSTILEASVASGNETDPSSPLTPGTRNYFALTLAGLYLLFSTILLLNLLIVKFITSYARVERDVAYQSVVQKIDFLREYQDKSVLPPPSSIIELVIVRPIIKILKLPRIQSCLRRALLERPLNRRWNNRVSVISFNLAKTTEPFEDEESFTHYDSDDGSNDGNVSKDDIMELLGSIGSTAKKYRPQFSQVLLSTKEKAVRVFTLRWRKTKWKQLIAELNTFKDSLPKTNQ